MICDVPVVSPGVDKCEGDPQITTVPSAPPAPSPQCNLDQNLTFHLVFVSISPSVGRFIYLHCWPVYFQSIVSQSHKYHKYQILSI